PAVHREHTVPLKASPVLWPPQPQRAAVAKGGSKPVGSTTLWALIPGLLPRKLPNSRSESIERPRELIGACKQPSVECQKWRRLTWFPACLEKGPARCPPKHYTFLIGLLRRERTFMLISAPVTNGLSSLRSITCLSQLVSSPTMTKVWAQCQKLSDRNGVEK